MADTKSAAPSALIDELPGGTIGKVSDVLSYLQELPLALKTDQCLDMEPPAVAGYWIVLQCCKDALGHARAEIEASRTTVSNIDNVKIC